MKNILSDSSMRWTKQRQLIYDEISGKTGHYTAEDIRNNLSKKSIHTSLSTIYRTLQLLEEKSIVRRVPLGKDTAVYESCEGTEHGHHHMHCTSCKETLEIHVDMLDDIEHLIKSKYNFTVTGHTVLFQGLCKNCAKNSNSNIGD
jgi:Fur family ferric uptake transcriptional regulator